MKQSYFTSCWNVISGCSRKHLWVNECSSRAVVCGGLPAGALGWAAATPPALPGWGCSVGQCQALGTPTWVKHFSTRGLDHHVLHPLGWTWFSLKSRSWTLSSSVFTHTGHTHSALLAVGDLSIHLRGQTQMRWAKSQRILHSPTKDFIFFLKRSYLSFTVLPNYFPLELLCIYLNKTTLCKCKIIELQKLLQ